MRARSKTASRSRSLACSGARRVSRDLPVRRPAGASWRRRARFLALRIRSTSHLGVSVLLLTFLIH